MKQLKWGFIGCGEVTEKKSGPAFSEVEGSSVEAVMSRSEQRARTYASGHALMLSRTASVSGTLMPRRSSMILM